MSKKDTMLEYISGNVDWFMDTSSYSVIPYYELSNSILNRFAQKCNFEIDKNTVVCLVSTSIMETGNSGILFTTEYIYTKSWGGWLTSSYKYRLNAYDSCEFSIVTEFNKERMREIMSDLSDISRNEDLKSIGESIGEIGKSIEQLLGIGSFVTDHLVEKNQASLDEGLNLLMEDDNIDEIEISGIEIYGDMLDSTINLLEQIEKLTEAGVYVFGEIKIRIKIVKLLKEFQHQITEHKKYNELEDFESVEEFAEYRAWLLFWSLLLAAKDSFRECYLEKELFKVPDFWEMLIYSSDVMYDVNFEDSILDFVENILDDDGVFGEDINESEMRRAIRSNHMALERFYMAIENVKNAWIDG